VELIAAAAMPLSASCAETGALVAVPAVVVSADGQVATGAAGPPGAWKVWSVFAVPLVAATGPVQVKSP